MLAVKTFGGAERRAVGNLIQLRLLSEFAHRESAIARGLVHVEVLQIAQVVGRRSARERVLLVLEECEHSEVVVHVLKIPEGLCLSRASTGGGWRGGGTTSHDFALGLRRAAPLDSNGLINPVIGLAVEKPRCNAHEAKPH